MNALLVLLFFFLLSFACETASTLSAFDQAAAFAKAGALMEAKSAYETALLETPTRLEIYHNLGIVEFRLGLLSEATAHLRHCIVHNPQDGEAAFFLGEILRMEEKLSQAVVAYQKTLDVTPSYLPALQALAWSYLELHQYKAAQKTVQKARAIAPQDVYNQLILAQIWIQQRQENKALDLLKTRPIAAFSPEVEALWYSTQGKAQLGLQEFRLAYESFRRALEKAPLLASALLGIGEAYSHFGQWAEAKEYMELGIHVNPKLTEGYYLLGMLLQNTEPEAARRYLGVFCQQALGNPLYTARVARAKAWLETLSRVK